MSEYIHRSTGLFSRNVCRSTEKGASFTELMLLIALVSIIPLLATKYLGQRTDMSLRRASHSITWADANARWNGKGQGAGGMGGFKSGGTMGSGEHKGGGEEREGTSGGLR